MAYVTAAGTALGGPGVNARPWIYRHPFGRAGKLRNARVGKRPRGLGFSLKPPAWLTQPIATYTRAAVDAAIQALKTNTNVTILGKTFNMGNPADVAALRAIAAGAAGAAKGGGPPPVTFQVGPAAQTAVDTAAKIVSNPLVLGGLAALVGFMLLRRGR